MKLRLGFISNSSSSSFVMIFSMNIFKEFKNANPVIAGFFEQLIEVKEFNGSKVGTFSEWASPGGTRWDTFEYENLSPELEEIYDENPDDHYPREVRYVFKEWMKKNGKEYLSFENDW
jgi:hypothetical protein